MIKKLLFSVVIFFLVIFLFIEQASLISIGLGIFLLVTISLDEYFSRKKAKKSFKPNPSELDELENELLLSRDLKGFFIRMSRFLNEKFSPKFLCYVTLTGNGFSVQHYEEQEQSNHILYKMLEERKAAKNKSDLIVHKSNGFSFPFFLNNEVNGYVFVGEKSSNERYYDSELEYMKPIARIMGKGVLLLENGRYKKEKNQLQSAFSKYVSPDVVDQIIHHPEIMHLGGEKQFLSVIFTDLQGFTAMSDSMDPVKLVRVLNMYLNEMSEVIIALGGTIDKFEGDAIMAFFGAPIPIPDHAVRCCKAALRMKKMEKIINNQLMIEKLIDKPLHTRIGINSGDMVVGNVGSLKRIDYTIIGGNVNIAARIENINKEYNTSILISDQTYELVKDFFETRQVDTVTLRGISRPVTVYELLKEKLPQNQENSAEVFDDFENIEVLEELEVID
ncbi:MAG: adenylate/guanylate cyclase domain-containing protein [Spirochaetaceae bacterium]|nr:adenylate/guanylate cyclase domain-containing protein [Spirochaetaceae bacterium]